MNYLIPMFNGVLFSNSVVRLVAGCKYELKFEDDFGVVFSNSNCVPFVFCEKSESENILKVDFQGDNYYFLFSQELLPAEVVKIKHKQKEILISLSSKLIVSCEGEAVCEKEVERLKFSHFESKKDFCFIFFDGPRRYLLVLKNNDVIFSEYYDEFNEAENETYFMSKCFDSLNHGIVCHEKSGDVSTYLVYLDNEDLNLKKEFVATVFLDCVRAKNLVYAQNLLCDDFVGVDIFEFFPPFDNIYPIKENVVILTNKNTLAGIFEFEIDDNKISNIIVRS